MTLHPALKTSLHRLNKYLDNNADDLMFLQQQYLELSNLVGFPEDGTNFGHNIFKLLLATEYLHKIDNSPRCLELLERIKLQLELYNHDYLGRFPEKNKSSKAPYSTSSFPIYKEIDYLPGEIRNYSVDHYLQLQFIRITLHLRLSEKYELSQFYNFFQDYKKLIAELIKTFPDDLSLEFVSDYLQVLEFVDKRQQEISLLGHGANKLVNYVQHIKNNDHKTPKEPHGDVGENKSDDKNNPPDNLDRNHSDNYSNRYRSPRGNVEKFIERSKSIAVQKILNNDGESSDEERFIDIYRKVNEDATFDGTESGFEDLVREQVQLEEKIEGESVAAAWNKKAASRGMLKTINRAQFLKLDWNALTDIERNLIVVEALKEFESDAEISIGAFGTLFTLTIGAEPMAWGDWSFCENENEPYINLNNGCYSHYSEFEDGRWEPKPEQLCKLEHQNHKSEKVELPMEDHIYSFLQDRFTNHKTVSGLLGITPKEIQDQSDDWIKNVLKKLNSSRWFSTKRVRDDLFFQIMFATYDEPMANHICAQNVYEIPMGMTYAQFNQSQLLKTYLSVQHPKLSFSQQPAMNPDNAIGSWLFPSKSYLKSFVQKLCSKYETALSVIDTSASIEQVVEAHNAFVSYLLFAGFVGTSTRHNDDPYPHQQAFLMELNALLITDKVIGYENETRISIFPDTFKKIMESYQEQLKSLRFWLAALGYKKEAGMILSAESLEQQQIPYVFYLDLKDSELAISSITRGVLDKKMPAFGLPWNFGRHLRAIWFRKLGVSPEYIGYDLGHIKVGEQPHASYSLLSVEHLTKEILPAVNEIFEVLGIVTIPAMPFKQRYPAKIEIDSSITPRELGYEKRKKKRLKGTLSDKDIVNASLSKINLVRPCDLTQKDLEKAFAMIMEANPRNLVNTLNLFSRIVSSLIRKNRLKIKSPSKLFKAKAEPSAFNDQSYRLINQAKIIQSKLEELMVVEPDVKELKTNLLLQKDLIWKNIFSLISHCHITNKSLITEVLEGINRQDFSYSKGSNVLCVMLRRLNGDVYKRVALHPISGILALRLGSDLKLPVSFSIKDWDKSNVIEIGLSKLNASCGFLNPLTLKTVLRASREYSKICYPGYICAKLDGRSGYGSYNEQAYARIENGAQFVPGKAVYKSIDVAPDESQASEWLESIRRNSVTKNYSFKDLKEFRRTLNKLLRETGEKQTLLSFLRVISEKSMSNGNLPQIGLLLLYWLIFMTEDTDGKEQGVTYIYSRFNYISRDLIEQFYDLDMFKMSAQERQEAYQEIIDLLESGQGTRKEGLLLFDKFLHLECGLSKVESRSLEAISEECIDANLVTEDEYHLVYSLLLKQSVQAATLFQLKWHLGDRPSEIPHITNKDIVSFDTEGYIIIKNRIGRGLKTAASKRLLLTRLTGLDAEPVTNLKLKSIENGFANVENLIDEAVVAIRQVTDDSTISIRNLRHGLATRWLQSLTNFIYFDENDQLQKEVLVKELGENLNTRRAIFLISRTLGHGGPSTLLYHYSHGHENVIGRLYRMSDSVVRRSKFYSTISGISDAAVRKYLSRNKEDGDINLSSGSKVLEMFWNRSLKHSAK